MTVSNFTLAMVVLSWPFKFIARIFGMLAGLFVVALVLPFAKTKEGSEIPFTDNPGTWEFVYLPDPFWMWSNDEDGALGDTRGWWDQNTPFGDCRSFLSKYWWLAIRNPFNNASRFSDFFACNIKNKEFEWFGKEYVRDDFNGLGWQLTFCQDNETGKVHGGFYWVHRWGNSDRALVVQLGNKIYPRHRFPVEQDPIDDWKGFTWEWNWYKDIS